MPISPFLDDLLQATTAWQPTLGPHYLDSAWQTAWVAATSETSKTSIARAWLWHAILDLPKESSNNICAKFMTAMDGCLSFLLTIQPYLDTAFFTPLMDREGWADIAAFLDPATPAHSELALVKSYFFGTRSEMENALAELSQMGSTYLDALAKTLPEHAWSLASGGNKAVMLDAARLSYLIGSKRRLPSQALPELGAAFVELGYWSACGSATKYSDHLTPRSMLQERLASAGPVILANVIYKSFCRDCYKTPSGDAVLRSDSFLVNSAKDTEPYPVLKRWFPERDGLLTNACQLGVRPVEAFMMIVNEPLLKNDTGMVLPTDLLAP